MEKIRLNDGHEMPQMGIGLYQVPDDDSCVEYVKSSLEMGFRLIDTAASYLNERSVGKGIKASGIPREEIFVTTKLWVQDYGYEKALKAIDGALERLGLEYVDLMLLHRHEGDSLGAYKAMEEAQKQGKIKSIGVCNYTVKYMQELLENTSVIPAVNQVECHPLQQEKALRELMNPKNIRLESWFPLGHGSKRLKFNETLTAMAEKYQKSISQIILRWHIQEGFVVIPKSMNPEHMKENMTAFDFVLDEADMEAIRALDMNRYLGGNPEDEEAAAKRLETVYTL